MNKVLIVDDDKVTRFAFSEVLRNNSFLPLDVPSGRQAIELFKKEIPDAMLLDLKMPDMDGIETMQELKKNRC